MVKKRSAPVLFAWRVMRINLLLKITLVALVLLGLSLGRRFLLEALMKKSFSKTLEKLKKTTH